MKDLFKCLALLSIALLLVLYVWVNVEFSVAILYHEKRNSTKPPNSTSTTKAVSSNYTYQRKVILIYTRFFAKLPWPGIEAQSLNANMTWRGKPCPVQNCEWTYDKNRFAESDVVIFHARNMPAQPQLDALHQGKKDSQLWAYYLLESPQATPGTDRLNGLFHWTITYRRDSDFWSPYGSYSKLTTPGKLTNFSVGKDKEVAWIVSNCGPSLRKKFTHELQKYIKVDVFGGCSKEFGGGSCTGDCKDTLKHYKFYLSFENALCRDYVTEKYWRHLGDEHIVPVVMSDPSWFNEVAIPGSFINAADFKTVKDLADYLKYLSNNSTAYNEYHKWRVEYRRNEFSDSYDEKLLAPNPWHCQMCERLNSVNFSPPKVYDRLAEFWFKEAKCDEMKSKFLGMCS